jgi:hypothetical protein
LSDLRGYTAFTETAEPEEVLEFLREYHGALGPLVAQFKGTFNKLGSNYDRPPADPRSDRRRRAAILSRPSVLNCSSSRSSW